MTPPRPHQKFEETLAAVFGERSKEFSPSLMTLLRSFYGQAQEDVLRNLEPAVNDRMLVALEEQRHCLTSQMRSKIERQAHALSFIQQQIESVDSDSPITNELRRLLWELQDNQ